MKTKQGQKTDGKGAAEEVETVETDETKTGGDAAQGAGSETPAEKEGEVANGDDSADESASDDSEESVEEEDEEDVENGVATHTRAQVNAIVKSRLDKERKRLGAKHTATVTALNTKVTTAEAERDEFRTILAAQVDAEVAALPDAVKAMAPAKTDTVEGLKKVREWLPNAKTLAATVAAAAKQPGNGPDPKAAGSGGSVETDEERGKRGKRHSIYRW